MYKILLCEYSLSYLKDTLFKQYSIDVAYNSEDIYRLTYEKEYDLYIINSYFFDAIEELKEAGDTTTVLFIDEIYNIFNIKKSFLLGDDYIHKPINYEELLIRVEYQLRKIYKNKKNIIRYKEFIFHLSTKQLYKQNIKINLSPNEIKVLDLLIKNKDLPVSKNSFFDTLESDSDGSLRVYISKLKKVGFDIEYDRINFSYVLH